MAKKIQDRRGAVQRLIDAVAKDGCPPRRNNYKTTLRAIKAGLIHFSVKHSQYRVGPEPIETEQTK